MVVIMKKMLVVSLEPKLGHRVACQIRSYFFTIRGFKKACELDSVRVGKIMLCAYVSALYDLDRLLRRANFFSIKRPVIHGDSPLPLQGMRICFQAYICL